METPDELGGDLQREACLPDATGTDDCDEPRIFDQLDKLLELPLSPEQRVHPRREVGRIKRSQRREGGVTQLVEPLRCAHVLQTMLTEIANARAAVQQRMGLRREHDLAPVSCAHDARGAVHVDADVPLVGDGRLPGVQADPDRHRAALQRLLNVRGCRGGIGRSREGDEEGVALCVDLDTPMGSDHLPHDLAVCDEHVCVPIAELMQEPGRPLDVREHERHGSAREVARHPARLTQRSQTVKVRNRPRRSSVSV